MNQKYQLLLKKLVLKFYRNKIDSRVSRTRKSMDLQ